MHYLTNRLKRSFKSCLSISSFIQTILLVLELHQIVRFTLADFTANREFHPAPKTLLFSCFLAIITSTTFGSNELKKVRKHFGNQGFFRMVGRQVDKVILFPSKQGSKCGKMDKKEAPGQRQLFRSLSRLNFDMDTDFVQCYNLSK